MDFIDATLVRLADAATRADLFDQLALEQLVAAGYESDTLGAEGPFQPIFDEVRLGVAAPRLATVDGTWNPVGGVDRTEASFRVAGIGPDPAIRVDAIWRGAIVARVSTTTDRIVEAASIWPALGTVDADIEADLGALPADPDDLEAERRTRVLDRLAAGLDQPARLTEARLAEVFAEAGVDSVGDLLERSAGVVAPGAVRVAFAPAPDAPPPPAPLALPVAVLVFIRGDGLSVAQLLADAKAARDQLEPLTLAAPVDASLHRRRPVLGVWIVPETTFDDDDWPGATPGMSAGERRTARRTAAGAWLADEGIAVAVPP